MRQREAAALPAHAVTLAVTAVMAVFLSGMANWRGGWCAGGPRYIAAVVPFLAFSLALGWKTLFAGTSALALAARTGLAALVLVSVFLCGLSGALFPHFPVQFDNPVFDLLLPLLSEGYVSHGLGTLLGLSGWAGLGPWLLAVAVAVAAALAGARPRWTAARRAGAGGAAAGGAVATGRRPPPARGGTHPGHRAGHVGAAAAVAGRPVRPADGPAGTAGQHAGGRRRPGRRPAGGDRGGAGPRGRRRRQLGGGRGGPAGTGRPGGRMRAEVQVALGEVRVRRGKDEAAVEAFGRAVDLAPQMVDGWLGLGEALARLGRHEPAREALRKVLARTFDPAPARAGPRRPRVGSRLALGEPARAVRELRAGAWSCSQRT